MRVTSSALMLAFLLIAGVGMAQTDESLRGAARRLGNEGIALYEQGDFAGATDRLERAYGVLKVSTLGLWSARALVKTGKLVEASERYLEVTRMQLPSDASDVMREAVTEAAREQRDLARRIPSLTVRLAAGEPRNDVAIELDGGAPRKGLLDIPVPVNPGAHSYVVSRGAARRTGELTVNEGEAREVDISFAEAAGESAPAAAANATTKRASSSPTSVASGDGRSPAEDAGRAGVQGRKVAGFAALGFGGVGLAVGGGFGLAALKKKSDLEDTGLCDGSECATTLEDEMDRYNTHRTLSTVGFIVGGVAAAGGVVLLATAPRRAAARGRVEPWVGLTAAGIRGRF